MRQYPEACKWIKGLAQEPCQTLKDDIKGTYPTEKLRTLASKGATTVTDKLAILRNYWERLWYRPEVNREEARDVTDKGWRGHERPEEKWDPVSADELRGTAKKAKGSTGGADGWHGTEVADIPG